MPLRFGPEKLTSGFWLMHALAPPAAAPQTCSFVSPAPGSPIRAIESVVAKGMSLPF